MKFDVHPSQTPSLRNATLFLSSGAKRFIRLRMNSTAEGSASRTRTYYVYIMASRSLNLYTGITNSIYRRALQHKRGEVDGFTRRYNINRLVYYEVFHQVGNAIAREKQIKSWTRAKRIAVIKTKNSTWVDIAEGWGEKFEMQIPSQERQAIVTRVLSNGEEALGPEVDFYLAYWVESHEVQETHVPKALVF